MTDETRHVARFSRRLAVSVATLAALTIGTSVGGLRTTAFVAAGLGFAWGAGTVDGRSNARRALGSVAVVAGGTLVVAGTVPFLGTLSPAATLSVLGLTVVALDVTTSLSEGIATVRSMLLHSLGVFAAAAALISALLLVVFVGLLSVLSPANAVPSTTPTSIVALQALVLAITALASWTQDIVERWNPGGLATGSWTWRFDPSITSRWYVSVLLVQVLLLAFVPETSVAVAYVLASTGPFGGVVTQLLLSETLYALLLILLGLELLVLQLETLRQWAVSALAPDPPGTLADAAGGVAVALGAAVVAFTPVDFEPFVAGPSGAFMLVGIVVVTAIGIVAFSYAIRTVFSISLLPDRTAGFALGSALLFAGAIAAAPAGVPPLVTFVGVAAALVVWDLGETAVDLGSHLGPVAATRRAEVVHATGTAVVATVGVALSAAAVYLVGPLGVPVERAETAVALAIIALAVFAAALD